MTECILYTSATCRSCPTMKDALNRLGVSFTEIKLKTGMVLPPDIRGIPALAVEKDGIRTTVCIGWPGSKDILRKILLKHGIQVNRRNP